MQKLKPITLEELKQHKPCQKAMDFIQSCDNSVEQAWNKCTDLNWIFWYLFYVEKCSVTIYQDINIVLDKWAKENLDANAYALASAGANALAYARAYAHAYAYANAYAYAYASARASAYAYAYTYAHAYARANAHAQICCTIRTIISF